MYEGRYLHLVEPFLWSVWALVLVSVHCFSGWAAWSWTKVDLVLPDCSPLIVAFLACPLSAGMPQGFVLKKMRVPGGPDNQDTSHYLQPQDFLPGKDVMIFGKNMHVVRCDSVAREFLEQKGFSVKLAEDFPEDVYEKKRCEVLGFS